MAKLGTVYADVEGDFSPIRRQMAVESARLSQTFSSSFATQQQKNLRAIGTAAKYAAIGVGGLATAMAVKGVKAGIQLNAQFESATAGIATFTGSTRLAEKHIERLRKVSAESPLRLTEYVEASRKLQGFGVSAEKVIPLLDSVNKAIVATGGGAEEMNRVTLALGQIQARGKASAEELLQLAEVGVPVQKILQKELGLTGEQVSNIGNEGIKSGEVLSAIARGWNREYGEAYENASQTFNMQTSRLTKNFEQVLRLSTEPLFAFFRDEWLPVLNETAEEVVAIWDKPGVTPERKFEQSFEAIKDGLGPLVDDIGRRFEDAEVGEKLLDAVNWALPRMAEAAGKGAGNAALAYAKGFSESGIWGKLVLGGFLISKMGLGPAIFRSAGTQAAQAASQGMVATGAGEVFATSGATAAGKWTTGWRGGLVRGGAVVGGVTAALQMIGTSGGIADTIKGQGVTWGRDYGDAIAKGLGPRVDQLIARGALGPLRELEAKLQESSEWMEQFGKDGSDAFRGLSDQVSRSANRIEHRMSSVAETFKGLNVTSVDSVREIRSEVEKNMKRVERSFDKHSAEGKELLSDNLDLAIDAVRRAMRSGAIGTSRGMREIRRLLGEQLDLYGVKLRDVIGKSPISRPGGPSGPGHHTGALGGMLPGYSKVDNIPLLARGGEAILRPEDHVPVVDASLRMTHGMGLNEMFRRTGAKIGGGRFAKGGLVQALGPYTIPPIAYDANHAGGNSHVHIHMSSPAAVIAIGRKLQQMGMMVSEHPAFGGVNFRHSATGGHYTAQAIDVNTAADETRAEVASIARLLGGAGVGALGGIGGIAKLKLPRFQAFHEMFGPAAGGLNKSAAGLEKIIGRRLGSLEGAEAGVGILSGSGDVEKTFARVAKKLSTSRVATLALGMAGYAESGMRDLSYGHSSSQGALQLLASTASSLGVSPHDEGAIASLFFNRGFYGRGGANALAAQGLPAHLVAQGVQGSAFSSGSNYLAQSGPAQAWMKRYGLKLGGMVKLPYAGSFDREGVVPGPVGKPYMATVHGGEEIGRQRKIEVHLHGPGMDAMVDEMYAVVDGERAEIAEFTIREGGRHRSQARALTGRR